MKKNRIKKPSKPAKKIIPIQRGRFNIVTRPKAKPVTKKLPQKGKVKPRINPAIKKVRRLIKNPVLRKKNSKGKFYYITKNKITSKAKWEKYRTWVKKHEPLIKKITKAPVLRKKNKKGEFYYINTKTDKITSKAAWQKYRDFVNKKKPHGKNVKKKPAKKKPSKRPPVDLLKVKAKPSALKSSKKFRNKGRIISDNIHGVAAMLCEIIRLNGIKCSYQYILDKIFYFVDYYMENPVPPEDAPDSWSEKDKIIYNEGMSFVWQHYERQKCIEMLHKFYENSKKTLVLPDPKKEQKALDEPAVFIPSPIEERTNDTNIVVLKQKKVKKVRIGKVPRFFIRPIVIKPEFTELIVGISRYLTSLTDGYVYLGVIIYEIYALAKSYYEYNKLPQKLSPIQHEIAKFMDFYDDNFTVQFHNPVEFKVNTKSLNIDDYLSNYFTGDVLKFRYFDMMALLDYHLTIMWQAKDIYLKKASSNTFDFVVYTMTESLTETYYVDFHNIDVDGADSSVGLSYIIAEFMQESRVSSVFLAETLRNKTGLDEPDELDEE